jgi:hypothetical protein
LHHPVIGGLFILSENKKLLAEPEKKAASFSKSEIGTGVRYAMNPCAPW